jgi:hypothetical protein
MKMWLVAAGITLSMLAGAPDASAQTNVLEPTGFAGVGTLTPTTPLEVVGRIRLTEGANSSEFFTGSSGGLMGMHFGTRTSIPLGFYTNSSAPWAILDTFGNFGLGTYTPGARLEVANGRIRLSQGTDASEFFTGSSGGIAGLHMGSRTNMAVSFYTNSSGPRLTVTTAGNVGIGTTTPVALFHVAGNAQVDGNIAAKYQDVAEWVPARSKLDPGTVVVLDSATPNEVTASNRPYDPRVAGVVSEKPGVLLGEGGENQIKVAHMGRVKVKVDASYGAVAIGDLLVTSPTPGYAMRSQPVSIGSTVIHQPGTLLGKALEPLDKGQAEVLVLLTLQ